jgi:hypothetical protein
MKDSRVGQRAQEIIAQHVPPDGLGSYGAFIVCTNRFLTPGYLSLNDARSERYVFAVGPPVCSRGLR